MVLLSLLLLLLVLLLMMLLLLCVLLFPKVGVISIGNTIKLQNLKAADWNGVVCDVIKKLDDDKWQVRSWPTCTHLNVRSDKMIKVDPSEHFGVLQATIKSPDDAIVIPIKVAKQGDRPPIIKMTCDGKQIGMVSMHNRCPTLAFKVAKQIAEEIVNGDLAISNENVQNRKAELLAEQV